MGGVALRGLGKRFPNGVDAVSGVDLDVADGEWLTVVGPSGSGKSTLLRLIAGLEAPTSGSVSIGGRDVTTASPRERDVAMVFQDPALFPYLSVSDNLAFGLRARGVGRSEILERVRAVAGTFGIGGELGRRPSTLSGGQKQRVALGRAVVREPAVFLFDEPLSGLDAPLRASIRGDLIDLHRRVGTTMIYVTHDQGEALALGDRVAVMGRGRIDQVGTPAQVYETPATEFVAGFVGSPPMNRVRCHVFDGETPVRLGLGGPSAVKIVVPDGPAARMLASLPDSSVCLGVRPEFVSLTAEPGAADPSRAWLRGEVRRVEYLGHESLATVVVGPAALSARLPGATGFRPGDGCSVGLDLARASWFDDRTGRALRTGRG